MSARSPVRMAHQPRYPRARLLAEFAVLVAAFVEIVYVLFVWAPR